MVSRSRSTGEIPWLAPTSTAKLIACPASLPELPTGGRPQPPSSLPANAGVLGHLAVQRWVESGSWRKDSLGESLVDHFQREAHVHGVVVERLVDGRVTESRLRAQEAALASAIRVFAGANGSVLTEKPMYDDTNHLWGTVDLLIDGERGATVVDLKSGADAAKEKIPADIRNQLLHYALLVLADRGTIPSTLAVFSLRRGLRVVEGEEGDLESLLVKIDAARQRWMDGIRPAVPSPDQCHFCGRRLACDAHWAAINEWEEPDATQGVLKLVENAANGKSSLTLSCDERSVWISDVPSVIASSLQEGSLTRGVRLRKSKREIHDHQNREIWYANEQSAFCSVPVSSTSKADQ